MSYDIQGRLLNMEDKGHGSVAYQYDEASNRVMTHRTVIEPGGMPGQGGQLRHGAWGRALTTPLMP